MVLFTENTMTAFLWEQDPLVDGFYRQISTKHGALHQGVVAEVNGVVFSMDRKGIVRWDGGVPTRISRPIQSDFASLDFDQAEKFHVAYCPEARALRWFVIYSGESKPTKYLQYNLETGTWGTGRYLQEITASGEAPMADGLGAFLGDSKGHLWIADQGNTDGISDAYSRGTIAAGSTATTVNLSGLSLPTGFGGVAGCFAFVPTPSGGTWARISSNTATQLVLEAPGLSTYAEGLPIWIGPVPAKLKTKAFVASDIGQKFRPRSLWVEFVPVSQGKLQVRAYENLSPTAKSWSSLARNDLPSAEFPGNNSNYPATDWVVDLSESDGNVRVPVGSEFVRSLALELECWEPGFELEVSALQLDADVSLEDEQ
ncbi:MAG: hypothetical protein D6812_02135 [Deltaproteobacteria bacterium]|nr:MAG: hypothetical protein D6812_02135 [Deltaproteobacteria bacterium]